jgi:prevent-host-death family protein
MKATEARVHFGELLRRVAEKEQIIIVERDGVPQAVILSMQEYQKLKEAQAKPSEWEDSLQRARQLSRRIQFRRQNQPFTPPEEIIRQVREERADDLH